MKLAKKTLSVALAAVMAASSLAGATSAFAADDATKKAVESSAVKYTAITGSATVKNDVKIDNAYALTKTEDLTTPEKKNANKIAQVDQTTLNTYYSFTPSRTGHYTMHVDSTAVYYGINQGRYKAVENNTAYPSVADKVEYATVYQNTKDGLYKTTAYAGGDVAPEFTKANAITEADAVDSVEISNVVYPADNDSTKTADSDDKLIKDDYDDAGNPVKWNVTSKSNKKVDDQYVLSYKYTKFNGSEYVVADKTKAETRSGRNVALVNDGVLKAGKTYYFKATLNQDLLISTKDKQGKDEKYTYTVKSTVNTSAKISISLRTGMDYSVEYEKVPTKDNQKLEVPSGTYEVRDALDPDVTTSVTAEYDQKTNKYYLSLPVAVGTGTATYYGMETSAKVDDTKDGAKIESFVNQFGGLQSLTLGKNVKYVYNVGKADAPNLKTVVINNPDFDDFAEFDQDKDKITLSVPANSPAWYNALTYGFKVNAVCTAHKWTTVKAATIFAAGQKKCSECGTVATIAKVKFAPTAKASKKKIVVKGNAGKVNKLAVWVYDSKGKLVKKQVKKNVTKNTVKVSKAGKYTVKVKAYGPNGAKTSSVKKTVKVK